MAEARFREALKVGEDGLHGYPELPEQFQGNLEEF